MEDVEKLIEFRTAIYSAKSEAAHYVTNTPARRSFRFSNPLLFRMTSGVKRIMIDGQGPFELKFGDVMGVPPGMEMEIDLGAASPQSPIECDSIEIESGRIENLISRMNENLLSDERNQSVTVNWDRFVILRGLEAEALGFREVMNMFRDNRNVITDLRIETKIDDMVLTLMQLRMDELMNFDEIEQDTGVWAVARLIRSNLDQHFESDKLAEVASLSASTLRRRFVRAFGVPPGKFANQMRVTKAKTYLRSQTIGIDDMAARLGFSDASHFTRVFRRTVGETPAEYRRARQQVTNNLQ